MKSEKLLGWAIIAAMTGLTSCNNDSMEALDQENEIKLTSEIVATRAATNLQATSIETNAKVGVNLTNVKTATNTAPTTVTNTQWTVGTGGVMTPAESAVYYYGLDAVTVSAYCPYDANKYESGFSVAQDQTADADYIKSDLLWAAEQTASKQTDAINLQFKHQLAKITIKLTSEDGYDLDGAVVKICGTVRGATFDSSNGTVTKKTGTAEEITAGTLTAANHDVSAIIIPQTINSGTTFVKVVYKERNFTYKLTAEKQFDAAHSYTYSLAVNEADVELKLTAASITDWTSETEVSGTADEEF